MQLQKSYERQIAAVSITIVIYLRIFGNFLIKDLKIMTTTIDTPQQTQDRVRGLLLVWRRELERKLQIN